MKTLNLKIGWAKNLTLPLLFFCAWLCIKNWVDILLTNVSKSSDIYNAVKLLKDLWLNILIDKKNNSIIFSHSNSYISNNINTKLYQSIRYSILCIWLLLSFFDELVIPNTTWWCKILWDRKNDIHYEFFEKIWYKIKENNDSIVITKDNIVKNFTYTLPIKSTSVSENILLYLILSYQNFSSINIKNFYCERPEITELLRFCNNCWYEIQYNNWCLNYINLDPKRKNIKNFKFLIMSDFDELLFYIFLWILSWIKVKINNYINNYSYNELRYLKKYLWDVFEYVNKWKNQVIISTKNLSLKKIKKLKIVADAYPSIMSDSQPLLSLMSLFYPKVYILDKRFKNRFWYDAYYNDFWYKTEIIDNGILIINDSPKKLNLKSNYCLFSIRESSVLLLLAMYNQIKISIDSMDILKRGYWNIITILKKIWTKIS